LLTNGACPAVSGDEASKDPQTAIFVASGASLFRESVRRPAHRLRAHDEGALFLPPLMPAEAKAAQPPLP